MVFMMSNSNRCSEVSNLGNQCSRLKGHEKPSNPKLLNSATSTHISYSDNGDLLQVWTNA